MKKISSLLCILFFLFMTNGWAFQADVSQEEQEETITLPQIDLDYIAFELLKSKKWQQAAEHLIMVVESRVSDPKLNYYIAYCFQKLGQTAFKAKNYADAIDHFDQAIEYVREWPHLYDYIGLCHFSLSRYDEAETAFSQALEVKPDHFTALWMMGQICYMTNRNHEALEYWQAALKVKPGHELIKKKVDELKELNRMSGEMESERDMLFEVSFNGTQKPQLREYIVKMLSDITLQIGQELHLYPKRQIPVILLTDRQFFDITGSPQWAGGVYEGHIKIPMDKYDPKLLKCVLTHEYIHAVIYDRLSYRCPWWLNEGIAQHFSGDHENNEKKLQLAKKYLSEGKVPDLEKLQDSMVKSGNTENVLMAYSLALSAVKYFVESYSTNDLQYILELMGEGKTFSQMLPSIIGYNFKEFLANWKESVTY